MGVKFQIHISSKYLLVVALIVMTSMLLFAPWSPLLNLTLDERHTLTLVYDESMGRVEITAAGETPVQVLEIELEHGTAVTLTAIPEEGYRFLCWVTPTSTRLENPRNFTIESNLTIEAIFALPEVQPPEPTPEQKSPGFSILFLLMATSLLFVFKKRRKK